jgi:Tol biopolymer transport system component
MSQRRTVVALAVLVASIFALGPVVDEASGQYFGRNKVQYKDFDFSVLETEHFDIYFYESEREAAILAGRMAERWYSRLSRVLDRELRGRQPIVFYASHPDFEQTNAIPGQIGESTGGVTEFLKRRIVLPMAGSLKETDHVLGHELVHAFQFDITGQGPNSVGVDVPVALRMPLWFIEGMAEYLSVGSVDPFTTQWLRGALQADELPDFGDLGGQRYFPYRYGHALWAYVAGRFGDETVGRILKVSRQSGNARVAMANVLGLPTDTLAADWHEAIRQTSGPVLEATQPADSVARRLIGFGDGGDLNMGPAVSPDGSEVVFASERGQFSLDLFLADAETGEIKNKITDTALDPHFESLQYLASAGAWSPDGERFAVAAVTRGRPVMAIFDPDEGRKVQEIRIPEVGEIFNPTWGPEGRRIVFSAQVGGFTDLYMLDLESEERTRLTEDPFAELHPAWSPDGRSIAFVTDRFTSDLEDLDFGDYRLGLMDPETTEISPVPGFEGGKHINPQWTPDGESLFFLADPDGITNIYRVDLASGDLARLTRLQTGVSGITAVSPALSVARDADNVVFSVHGEGNFVFNLYAIDDASLAGEPVASTPDRLAMLEAGQLPPPERVSSRVDGLLADAQLGLADTLTFEISDYSPTLSLDYVGRPNLAVGADQFGFFIGGGGSIFFSDMLGNRSLATLFQVDGSSGNILNSTALFGGYENRSNRWNWGVQGGQIPLISRRFGVQETTVDGQNALLLQDVRFWQINRQVTGVVHYPFNRSQRVEFSGGARNIEFASEVRETLLSPSGQVIAERERDFAPFDTISSLNTVQASAALVYDNSLFGATAPMAGQRYRFEVTPTAGSIDYYSVLADYRRYLMPFRPFTLAGRAMHFGRYGGGSEDFRLREFFIGFPSLVRGYDASTFTFDECEGGTQNTCPAFDQLLGSRIGVFNAEARLPVLGGIGLIPAANVPPIDLIAFFDAGVAWTRDTEPEFLDGSRNLVRSVGVGARMNLFGLLILELDYVNPLDREQKDWFWDLSLTPGF